MFRSGIKDGFSKRDRRHFIISICILTLLSAVTHVIHDGPCCVGGLPDASFKNDLYSLTLGIGTSDQLKQHSSVKLIGVDEMAVEVFGDYNGYSDRVHEVFQSLPVYMDAQRFRTPRGLDHLRTLTDVRDQNTALIIMQQVFQYHTTMWAEGVWEIVRARQSPTKFILTDEPVTFFNRRLFPSECVYPGGIELDKLARALSFRLALTRALS